SPRETQGLSTSFGCRLTSLKVTVQWWSMSASGVHVPPALARNRSAQVLLPRNAGSFDFVRLSPHFAQDDSSVVVDVSQWGSRSPQPWIEIVRGRCYSRETQGLSTSFGCRLTSLKMTVQWCSMSATGVHV